MKNRLLRTYLGSALAGLLCFALYSCSSGSTTTNSTTYPYGTTTYGGTTYSSITVPTWAPAYGDLTNVRYYFLPDCDAYYDASTQQFMIQSNGSWISSSAAPSTCSNLTNAFTVMLNSSVTQPWLNNAFYQANYPAYSYSPYDNIVTSHALLTDIPSGYSVAARGFNENTNRVIFIEQPSNGTVTSYIYRDVPMTSISAYMPEQSHTYYYGGGYPSR